MAARSCDLDQPKYAKKLFIVNGHILAKFHDSGSNSVRDNKDFKSKE